MRGPTAEHDPGPDLAALAEVGIDMRQVTDALLADGLRQFEVALGRRLAGIDERSMAVITRRPPTIRAKLSPDLRGALGAGYTLGTLIAAQAAGDLQALRAHGLSEERSALEGEPAVAVCARTERISGLLQGG
jgi:hypothetical protein